MSFSVQWKSFCREAEIAAISLYDGFNYQLKANESEKAFFSKSFFSLSIGLERLLKLIIILDDIEKNQGKLNLTNKDLKKYNHNIMNAYISAKKISRERACGDLSQDFDKIDKNIIQLNILEEIIIFPKIYVTIT